MNTTHTTTNLTRTDPAQIEADIARQREQLAHTVDALSEKLDVKARVQRKAAHLKESAVTHSGSPRPTLLLAVGGTLTATALLVWWRRHN